MKIINWNISWMNKPLSKIEYLKNCVWGETFIIILQEVKKDAYEVLKREFSEIASLEYSLDYRTPGKYDTDSRKLGIAIIVSKDIKVLSAKVLDRTIMPDRTLLVEVEYDGQRINVMGLHSITGCQHLKAKEIQYYGFAEAVDEFQPDIIGIDANEPQIDHYDISKMKFFDNYNKGNGCKTFFETIASAGLKDSYVKHYDCDQFVEGEYLTTSHIIKRGKKRVRYDFLFVSEKLFEDYVSVYDYENAIITGSDHAAVILDVIAK